jgi:transcriptional regulator with GAF, ATPase, and Fis domain
VTTEDTAARGAELPGARYEELVDSLIELTLRMTEDASVRDTLHSILALALGLVPGCDAASVTVIDGKGQPSTIVATDDQTQELDRRQYALGDGPCLDAARRQQVNRWTLGEAVQRWPEFTGVATELGLHSYLAAGLGTAERPLGALNLSSRSPDGFDHLDEKVVALFTAPATAAIMVAGRYAEAHELAGQLQQAMQSRSVIDQALGIIMAESRCTAGEAFATLSRASNNRSMKLRELAAEIVGRVTGGQAG